MSSSPGERSTIDSLQPVPGNLPDLKRADLPACRFAERCERAAPRCTDERPRLDARRARRGLLAPAASIAAACEACIEPGRRCGASLPPCC